MTAKRSKWQRLSRREIYQEPFLTVYEDKVALPNGQVIEKYSLLEKKSGVTVVALNKKGEVATLVEYKYGLDDWIKNLPAGCIETDESPLETGKRELREETGYGGGEWSVISELNEYPSKDLHRVWVVLAQGVEKLGEPECEMTESIAEVNWQKPEELLTEIREGEWRVTSNLAALFLALYSKNN